MHLGNLALVGLGIYMIGHGVTMITNPGAYAMIGGGICVVIAAFI